MERQTRNHAAAGVALLLGAAAVAFAATQAWAKGAGALWGRLAGVTVHGSLGFDVLVAPGGRYGNVQPLLMGCAVALAVLALLLLLTRVPGLGILWRVLALAPIAVLGLTAATGWVVVNDPASVLADTETPAGLGLQIGTSLAEAFGLAAVEPGPGLWVLTAGTAIAAFGLLIPASRGRTVQPPAVTAIPVPREPVLTPGWYPDQFDGRFLRFFDGAQWTLAIRPRGRPQDEAVG